MFCYCAPAERKNTAQFHLHADRFVFYTVCHVCRLFIVFIFPFFVSWFSYSGFVFHLMPVTKQAANKWRNEVKPNKNLDCLSIQERCKKNWNIWVDFFLFCQHQQGLHVGKWDDFMLSYIIFFSACVHFSTWIFFASLMSVWLTDYDEVDSSIKIPENSSIN